MVPLTHHVSLRQALEEVKTDRIVACGKIVLQGLRERFNIEKPRLAVAGLNPHAGEDGAFGMEEIEEIGPAVEALGGATAKVTGPFSPDTLFTPAKRQLGQHRSGGQAGAGR